MKLKLNIDKMGMINAASYLSAPNDALLYRTIMRTLYIEKESYRSQMSTEELFDSLKQYDEFSDVTLDKLKNALSQLTEWGCVSPMQDPRRVRTIEEYQNKVYRYSLTEDALIIERMTVELEQMFSQSNTLSSSLLVRINDAVRDIPVVMKEKSNKELNEWWRNLQEDFKRLNRNFSDYLFSFYSVKGEKLITSVQFLAHKEKFIEYLRDFITQLQKHSVRIEINLKRLDVQVTDTLLNRLVESEMEIPRTNSEMIGAEEIREKIQNDWNGLYAWFVSSQGRESTCNSAMEYTNDIIRKMVNNAILLMQLQNAGISRKQDYRKYMQMFADCENINDAHCLSAHVFGVMNVAHYKYNSTCETDSIYENAADLAPQVFEVKPVSRTYKPRIKTEGVSLRSFEKEIFRQSKIAAVQREREMTESYMKNKRLDMASLAGQTLSSDFRITLLKWIALASQNTSKTAMTDFGRRFRLIPSDQYITLHFEDGDLYMPAYVFEFGEDNNE